MSHSKNDGIVFLIRKLSFDADTILVLHLLCVCPWVVDVDVVGVFAKGVIDVHHLGVTDVGTVLLERDAEDKNLSILHKNTFLVHTLHHLISNIVAHTIIQATSGKHNTRKNAIHLCFLYEIIRVDADAMSAHQTRFELYEIPFRSSSLNHVIGIDAHSIEYLGKLVHEGNVDVALRILYYLRSLSYANAWCLMGSIDKHRVVNTIYDISHFGCRTRGHFLYFLHRVEFVAWIDALRTVSSKEIDVILQSADTLHDGQTFFFCHTRVDGRLIYHDVAL